MCRFCVPSSGFHNAECNEGDQTSTTTFEQAAQRLYGSAVGQKLGIAKDTLSGRDFQTRNVTRNTNDVRNFSRPTNQLWMHMCVIEYFIRVHMQPPCGSQQQKKYNINSNATKSNECMLDICMYACEYNKNANIQKRKMRTLQSDAAAAATAGQSRHSRHSSWGTKD